jgi:hypothetical protein
MTLKYPLDNFPSVFSVAVVSMRLANDCSKDLALRIAVVLRDPV